MLSYLITSDKYYGVMDSNAPQLFYKNMQDIYKQQKTIEFACFRYDNADYLTSYEIQTLIAFLYCCYKHRTLPILNFSRYKLEIFYALYLCGLQVGIHFKESDMLLLEKHIALKIKQHAKNTYRYNANAMKLDSRIFHCYYAHIQHILQTQCYQAFFLRKQNLYTTTDSKKTYRNLHLYSYKHILFGQQKSLLYTAKMPKYQKQPIIFYSAHSLEDMQKALRLGVDFVTISPIFYDKGNKALGIDFLANMPKHLKQKSFALGGINNEVNVRQIRSCELLGFASISYFTKFLDLV